MHTIKTTISILVAGLLLGAAGGVAAQDEEVPAAVTTFTGVFSPDGEPLPGQGEEIIHPNGFMEGRPGFAWKNRLESDDPRIAGDHRVVANWVLDPVGFDAWSVGQEANMILSTIHELTNDGGSWLGEGALFSSTELDLHSGEIITFVGQGGYDGLTAYALVTSDTEPPRISGVIFPTTMPPTPESFDFE